MQWTIEWTDSKTSQLISCESPIFLKERPSYKTEEIEISTFTGHKMYLPGKSQWNELEIDYFEENLASIFLNKWMYSLYENTSYFSRYQTQYADVCLRYYECNKKREEWFLEQCFIHAMNYNTGQMKVNFKFGKGSLIIL